MKLYFMKTPIKPLNLFSLLQDLHCYPYVIRFINESKDISELYCLYVSYILYIMYVAKYLSDANKRN